MSLFRDADPRFQGLDAKVAVFAVLAAIAAIALVVAVAVQQGYFTSHTELHAEVPTGTDLHAGMAVKLSGFKIGEVRSVDLNERARVDVRLRIEDRYMKWVKADSIVSISREGLIGDPFLSITSGNPSLAPLKAGESLTFIPTPALADIAQDLRNRILPVIDGTKNLLGYLNDPQGDFRASMADLRRLTAELHDTRKKMDSLIVDADKLAREDIRHTLENTDRTLGAVEKDVNAMSARTDASLAKLDAATASAQQAADSATKAIGSASPRIDRLLDNTDAAVSASRKLMDGAGKHWPFKGGEMPKDDAEAQAAATSAAQDEEKKKAGQ